MPRTPKSKDLDYILFRDIAKQLEAYRMSRYFSQRPNPKALYSYHNSLLKRLAERLGIEVLI